ncbi:hypothetical protein P7K49_035342 [Saguinus oedipus]|uniref:Uncharacterized protein n=1 Tax=Saguinus oedipus TaxID=9490 RepID=A0ABQ9TMB3_SAGOE|nr:hypothetical protein P7K49_035342 [Saguinus oedipus]
MAILLIMKSTNVFAFKGSQKGCSDWLAGLLSYKLETTLDLCFMAILFGRAFGTIPGKKPAVDNVPVVVFDSKGGMDNGSGFSSKWREDTDRDAISGRETQRATGNELSLHFPCQISQLMTESGREGLTEAVLNRYNADKPSACSVPASQGSCLANETSAGTSVAASFFAR